MIKGRKVGLRRTVVILLHKKLWAIVEELSTMTRRIRRKGKRESVSEERKAEM